MKLKYIRKIAVLRVNALGDFIFILPAMEALRAAYPEAEIVLLGRDWHAEFLAGRPGPIDRAIVVPPSRGLSREEDYEEDPAELDRFFAAMAVERFDLAFQLHGGGRYSNPFIRRLGARMTAGLATPDVAPLDRMVPYIYFQPEILRYLEVVGLVGATTTQLEPRLCVTAQDLEEACRVVPELDHRPVVALHPGASALRRRWPVESFAAVGQALRAAGAQVVVTGVEWERDIVEGVIEAMHGEVQNLCGQLSLGGLAGLLSRCRVVVSNDSGPLHLAAAVGAATVGIYWCGNLINSGPMTRTRHRPLVSWRLNCPLCGRNCMDDNCDHTPSFVADISVEEVTTAALDLLALPVSPRH
ncbi:MAG: glycosyltransferase family 9 protein [Anaerolineae bacterium]|nr:glycosyltransferase family 9 protein [Anaerolineae bacterium]